MGFRFQKRIKLLPGLRINLSKSGVSTSVGTPGATVNFRKGKKKLTVGVPGSGLSYSTESKRVRPRPHRVDESSQQNRGSIARSFFSGLVRGLGPVGMLILGCVVLYLLVVKVL